MYKTRFIISLFYASTCFEHYCAHHQEVKIVYTASGIITPVGGRPVHGAATYRVLVTLILLRVNSSDVRLCQWIDRTDENLHGYNYRPSAT